MPLDAAHDGAEETRREASELLLRTGRVELVRRRRRALAKETVRDEHGVDVLRRLFRGRDEENVRTHDVADRSLEERVVRAAEDQRVDAGGLQLVEVGLGDLEDGASG